MEYTKDWACFFRKISSGCSLWLEGGRFYGRWQAWGSGGIPVNLHLSVRAIPSPCLANGMSFFSFVCFLFVYKRYSSAYAALEQNGGNSSIILRNLHRFCCKSVWICRILPLYLLAEGAEKGAERGNVAVPHLYGSQSG